MRSLRAILLILIIMVSSGCYRGINGKVVDNTSGKPLEGALVVVQWTKPVLRSIEGFSADVILNTEILTDKEGVFVISRTPNSPFANQPRMIIYKEGYIPWQNDAIFPSVNRVKEPEWINNMTYKLDVFTDKYSTNQLYFFVSTSVIGPDTRETPLFNDIRDKISRKSQAESEAKQKNKWLNDFRTVIQSLDKGSYYYDDIRSRLMEKATYEIDWLVDQAKNTDSAVSTAMKEHRVTLNHLTEGSKGFKGYGSSSIVFTKK